MYCQDWQKVISTISKSTSSSSSSVLFQLVIRRRNHAGDDGTLPTYVIVSGLMPSHLDAANSFVTGGFRSNNHSNNYILSSQFHVYFIFKPVPFFPEFAYEYNRL